MFVIGTKLSRFETRVGLCSEKIKLRDGYRIDYGLDPRFDIKDYMQWVHQNENWDCSDWSWGPKLELGHFQLGLAIIWSATKSDKLCRELHKPFAQLVCTKLQNDWIIPMVQVQGVIEKIRIKHETKTTKSES